jgi:hypothetical protein
MKWDEAPRPAQRVLYVRGKWTDKEGRPQAMVQPEPLLELLIPRTKQAIHGDLAKSKSRRAIDEFGFGQSLRLILHFCDKALKEGKLSMKYVGRSTFAGRPTYVLERTLPYNGDEEYYPERRLILYIDEEWLLPTCIIAYADDNEKQLLGRYLITDVEFNLDLSEADFSLD